MIDIAEMQEIATTKKAERQTEAEKNKAYFHNTCLEIFKTFDLENVIDKSIKEQANDGVRYLPISLFLKDDTLYFSTNEIVRVKYNIQTLATLHKDLLEQPIFVGMNSLARSELVVVNEMNHLLRINILSKYREAGYKLGEDKDNYLSSYVTRYTLTW